MNQFVLIIGAMKGGTTSIFEILSQHPGVCPSKIKEPDYFVKDRDSKACEDYLKLWNCRNNQGLVSLESSVAYTKVPYIPGVPERIAKSGLGDFRFIYMLRDPLERIESQIRHSLFAGWGKSLDNGIQEDAINFSRYAMQLDQYLEYFSKESILVVILEEFQSSPHLVLKKICEFMGIDNDFQFQNVEEPRNSGEFFNSAPIVAKITRKSFGQFVVRRVLPRSLKNWIRSSIAKVNKKKKSTLGRWQLNEEERRYIYKELGDDLNRLESEFGVDIRTYWQLPSN